MTQRDSDGNPTTVSSQTALDPYEHAVWLFLGANFGATKAFQAAFTLGDAGLARSLRTSGQKAQAKQAIARAQQLAEPLEARQRQHVACLAMLLSGQPVKTRSPVKRMSPNIPVTRWPRSCVATSLA